MPNPYYSPNKQSTTVALPFDDDDTQNSNVVYKVCNNCKIRKPVQDFYKDRDGHSINCKICKDKINKITKNLHKTAPQRPHACECCGKVSDSPLVLDHDHETGKFRGWICIKCNLGLGRLGDTIESLMRAVEYLKKSASRIYGTSLFDEEPTE
jgi:hypothetical protein